VKLSRSAAHQPCANWSPGARAEACRKLDCTGIATSSRSFESQPDLEFQGAPSLTAGLLRQQRPVGAVSRAWAKDAHRPCRCGWPACAPDRHGKAGSTSACGPMLHVGGPATSCGWPWREKRLASGPPVRTNEPAISLEPVSQKNACSGHNGGHQHDPPLPTNQNRAGSPMPPRATFIPNGYLNCTPYRFVHLHEPWTMARLRTPGAAPCGPCCARKV